MLTFSTATVTPILARKWTKINYLKTYPEVRRIADSRYGSQDGYVPICHLVPELHCVSCGYHRGATRATQTPFNLPLVVGVPVRIACHLEQSVAQSSKSINVKQATLFFDISYYTKLGKYKIST